MELALDALRGLTEQRRQVVVDEGLIAAVGDGIGTRQWIASGSVRRLGAAQTGITGVTGR